MGVTSLLDQRLPLAAHVNGLAFWIQEKSAGSHGDVFPERIGCHAHACVGMLVTANRMDGPVDLHSKAASAV
jgi:hypothetical protein